MKLSMTSTIKLVPVEIRRDKKHFIVEDQFSGEFYEMAEVCIDAIKMIQDGILLGEIELQLKQKYPQEDVNLLVFAEQLLELGLINEIEGIKLDLQQKKQQSGFQWVSPWIGKLFFNKSTKLLYFLFFIVNIAIFMTHPNLLPYYQDLFVFHLMVLNVPILLVLMFILVLIHEFGHILAIRAYNLPTKMEIGHRLFLVVFETDMSSVWKLPAKDRNGLYLAGLYFDNVILFFTLACQLLFSTGDGIFHAVLRLIVLDTFIRMIYQVCIYMKTDLYYVFENSSSCYNLMENAQQLLRKRFKLMKKIPSVSEVTFESERKTVFWYSIFYVTGVAITIVLYFVYYIPQLFYAVKKILPGFEKPIISLSFWNSAVCVLQILIVILLLVYSWTKKYRSESE